jgi:hypothetical protein
MCGWPCRRRLEDERYLQAPGQFHERAGKPRGVLFAFEHARSGDQDERVPAAEPDIAHLDRSHADIIRISTLSLRDRLARGRAPKVGDLVLVAGFDERCEEWVRPGRLRLEFRVKLDCQVPWMIRDFSDFDELAVW